MADHLESEGPEFRYGDRVLIKHFGGRIGRITELRGPLGPGGVPVYRILYQKKPSVRYIEVLGDQLEHAPKAAKPVAPAAGGEGGE